MLSAEARNRLTVILVGARNPQNIGAAARAMQDFGFADLRVVNDFTAPFEAAQLEASSAVGAAAVMQAAKLYTSLPEALADCTLMVGTTAIGGRELRSEVLALQQGAPMLHAALQAGAAAVPQNAPAHKTEEDVQISDLPAAPRVALLFGSEKTGLTREQLSHCSLLLTIPLFAPEGRHLSMNLGQAVAVCLYELTRDGFEGSREIPIRETSSVTSADRERLLLLLSEVMAQSGYARRFPANARLAVVRQLVGHLGTTKDETATWMGLLKLVQHRMASSKADSGA